MKKKSLETNVYSFDVVYRHVRGKFDSVMDLRKGSCTYSLGDILASGFALFSLKSSSVLNYVEQTEQESSNIKSVYRINSFAKESQFRAVLDEVEEGELCDIQVDLIHHIWDKKLKKRYENIGIKGNKYLQVNLDGVEHFNSKKISCPAV